MRNFSEAIAQLQQLRHKFEGLLEKAHTIPAAAPHQELGDSANPLSELRGFGSNPGNLRMFVHVPPRLPRNAPLVVALHGCSQSAADYDRGTGWSKLADRLGFAVVYAEQQRANNPNTCFSWFVPDDTTRGQGEALSIRQMIAHAIVTFGNDPQSVFVTGLSAGGAMASVMLATYPEVFAGGAIIAGLPYGCARTVQQAFEAMFNERSMGAAALGDRVRAASDHRGPWPKISVWHGAADPIVKPTNSEDIVRQWTDLHGLSAVPSREEAIGDHRRRVWNDAGGETLIEAFSITGMAHGVPLSTVSEDRCGVVGPFFLEAGISSTHHIASFWGLGDDLVQDSSVPGVAASRIPVWSDTRAMIPAADAPRSADETAAAHLDGDAPTNSPHPFDPKHVIASAMRAAGMPVPDLENAALGNPSSIDPAGIIKAALKAAGLKRG
jgi:feruloyl esterase